MASNFGGRLSFIAEWYQEEAAIIKSFILIFYKADNAIEVFDQNTKKPFLRRTKMPELTAGDFFIGSKINVFGRQFDLIDYGDEMTKNNLAKFQKKGFILLKNVLWTKYLGALMIALADSGISINNGLMAQFTAKTTSDFLKSKDKGDVQISVLMNELLVGPSIGFEIIGENIVEVILGCQNLLKQADRSKLPTALMSLFEKEEVRNGIYCSENDEAVTKDLAFFFSHQSNILKNCEFKNSTLAVIKPHCIKEGNLGNIVQDILDNGFKITALRMLLMARVNCEEFFEVYRGVLGEYMAMVGQLASGTCMCLEIVCADPAKNAHKEFRDFCGPIDPEIAKLLRPQTLRAKFGKNKVLNAIHCTDLPDDTTLELQYLFKIIE